MTTTQAEPGNTPGVCELNALQTEQAGPDKVAAELLALGQDCAARLTDPWRDLDHGALLSVEQGRPR